jgi:hypothetical protein
MILERDESETDCVCHKGSSLQKVATESPEKWYIPLEHYTRITENLGLELRESWEDVSRLRVRLRLFQITAGILLLLLIVMAKWGPLHIGFTSN